MLLPGAALAQDPASLYERLGRPLIDAIADDFVDRVLPDPELNRNPDIAKASPKVPVEYMKVQLAIVFCERSGGPCKHGGRPLKEALAPLNYREADWQRSVALFKSVLREHGVAERETGELLAIFDTMRVEMMPPERKGGP